MTDTIKPHIDSLGNVRWNPIGPTAQEQEETHSRVNNTDQLFYELNVRPKEKINVDKIKSLIDKGVDLWQKDMYMQRPVQIAMKIRRYDIVTLLYDAEDNYKTPT